MSIEGCPTCGGEGWITTEGGHPLSHYEREGLLEMSCTLFSICLLISGRTMPNISPVLALMV